MADLAWTYSCCGRRFESLLLDVGFAAPAYHDWLAPEERAARARLHSDFCIIDDEHRFIRACLEVPVHGLETPFVWGLWVSLSRDSMRRAEELFEADAPEGEPPRFGWISNRLPGYPDTLALKAMVRFRERTLRPLVELDPESDHPLAREQREGITLERVREIVRPLMHA